MSSNKKTKDNSVKKYIFEVIYIAIFIAIAVFVGLHHEHWADEAQSWLIARDNDVIGIFKAIRYEGTPALWQLLLKFCIVLGMEYDQLYILTTALTVIGIIFLHKNENVPLVFKILLPYTYYIFFQYTIVARSYTLLFPILMAIVYLYPNKKEHLVKYGILLTLLMNVSLHGFLLAGGFWLEFLIEEVIISKKDNKKIEKGVKKFFIILALLFFSVALYFYPASDCVAGLVVLEDWYKVISGILFTSSDSVFFNILGIIACSIVIFRLIGMNNTKQLIRTSALLGLNFCWITCIHSCSHHIGILFLIIISIAFINNNFKNDKVLYVLLVVSMIIQIYWNVSACIHDIKYPYSAGDAVSEYLKEIGVEDKKIIGVDYWSVQVNPFFDKNIFANFDNSYQKWSKEQNDRIISKYVSNNDKLDADIYVIAVHCYYDYNYKKEEKLLQTYSSYYEELLMKKLEATGQYIKRKFDGDVFFKDVKFETTGIYVYSKK